MKDAIGYSLLAIRKNSNGQKLKANSMSKGFTLIELLVVITIIGILVAAGSYSWQSAQLKSRDNKRKSDIKAVQQALESYYLANGKYPSSSAGSIQCNIGSSTVIAWGTAFTCAGNIYMRKLPTDSNLQATNGYYYDNTSFGTYTLSANLENIKDADLTSGNLGCSPQTGRNFCVKNP